MERDLEFGLLSEHNRTNWGYRRPSYPSSTGGSTRPSGGLSPQVGNVGTDNSGAPSPDDRQPIGGSGGGGGGGGPEPEKEVPGPGEGQQTLLNKLASLLGMFFTATEVQDFIENIIKPGLTRGLTEFEIMRQIRETDTHKNRFPEYFQRIANGYAAEDEATILRYRDDARNLVKSTLGKDLEGRAFSTLIANNVSLDELAKRLRIQKIVESWGPQMIAIAEERGGVSLTDDDIAEYLDEEIDTPEWDEIFEFTAYQRPLVLGLGRRSDEQIEAMKALGIDPDQGFERSQAVAANKALFEKFAAIENNLTRTGADYLNRVPENVLWRHFVLRDPNATAFVESEFSKEAARFNQRSGVARSGTAAVGLLNPNER